MGAELEDAEYMQMMWDYFMEQYGEDIEAYRDQCPYDLAMGDEQYAFKQLYTWLMCERRNSEGKTIVDEFVEGHELDERTASKILQMRDITYDTFVVQSPPDRNNILAAVAKTTGKRYRIWVSSSSEHLAAGRAFTARIHPWHDDGAYMTIGIMGFLESRDDMLERHGLITPRMTDMIIAQMFEGYKKNAESIPITAKSQAHTLLKRLPAEWIDAMYDALGIRVLLRTKKEKAGEIACALTSEDSLRRIISKLGRPESDALWMVLKQGGIMKYPELCKSAGEDDTQWSWTEEPESAVGRLRRRGLLIVGKMRMGSRAYRVAAIPADVTAPLARCFEKPRGAGSKWHVGVR